MTLTNRGRLVLAVTITLAVVIGLYVLVGLSIWFGLTHDNPTAWSLPILGLGGGTGWFYYLATHAPHVRPGAPSHWDQRDYSAHNEQAAVAGKRRTR